MDVIVRVEPATAALPAVKYRWDKDTEILTVHIAGPTGKAATDAASGLSGSVELEGMDGSWLMLEVEGGFLRSIEVAVWPEVHTLASLAPPPSVADVVLRVPARPSQPGLASMEVTAPLRAETDPSERTIHFALSPKRARTVRVARDVLIDLSDRDAVTGVWLLNVPPFPRVS